MAKLSDFDSFMQKEMDTYLQSIKNRRGEVTNKRQSGQRKRRLREHLYKLSSQTSGNLVFTTTEDSFKDAAINAMVKDANIENSIGQELERFGSPAGGEIIDDTNYEEEVEEDEVLTGYRLKPKNAQIFGDKDGFGDWFVNVYLQGRPLLRDMIFKVYWYTKDGIKFGADRDLVGRTKALKYASYMLRKKVSENGIMPNSVIITKSNTILKYDRGTHILDKGRD